MENTVWPNTVRLFYCVLARQMLLDRLEAWTTRFFCRAAR